MKPALKMALTQPETPELMRQVVFITDGAVGNESDLLKTVASNLGDSRMFTVAIGHAPNSWFMRKTAEIGRGSYIRIGKLTEVEQKMSALWGRIQIPARGDVGGRAHIDRLAVAGSLHRIGGGIADERRGTEAGVRLPLPCPAFVLFVLVLGARAHFQDRKSVV